MVCVCGGIRLYSQCQNLSSPLTVQKSLVLAISFLSPFFLLPLLNEQNWICTKICNHFLNHLIGLYSSSCPLSLSIQKATLDLLRMLTVALRLMPEFDNDQFSKIYMETWKPRWDSCSMVPLGSYFSGHLQAVLKLSALPVLPKHCSKVAVEKADEDFQRLHLLRSAHIALEQRNARQTGCLPEPDALPNNLTKGLSKLKAE